MSLNNYAYYNTNTGFIDNVLWIEDDVVHSLTWPEGYAIVDIPEPLPESTWLTCGIGWSYINSQFVEPPAPPEPVQPIAQGTQTL